MILNGKIAVISGGSRGMGKAIVNYISKEGAHVVIIDLHIDGVNNSLEDYSKTESKITSIVADVSSIASITASFNQIIKDFGHIDILINNAGIQGSIGQLAESEIDQWIQTIQTNLVGTYLCSRLVLPSMIQNRSGKIINLAGGGATSSRKNFSAYASSKTAIVRLTETLADEVREFGIYVNAISPGAINTNMTQEVIEAGVNAGEKEFRDAQHRLSIGGNSPDDAADLVIFLSSHESDGITGKLISAIWDPWREKTFQELLRSDKDIATLRRIDNKTYYRKI